MFDCLGGNPPPERNTAWNKGRKCFHCLGAPNNLIHPCQVGCRAGLDAKEKRGICHYWELNPSPCSCWALGLVTVRCNEGAIPISPTIIPALTVCLSTIFCMPSLTWYFQLLSLSPNSLFVCCFHFWCTQNNSVAFWGSSCFGQCHCATVPLCHCATVSSHFRVTPCLPLQHPS